MTEMMKAVIVEDGAPLRLGDVEVPTLKPGEVLVKVAAAGLNRADLIQRKLGTVATNLYASPEYLKQNGMPRTPQDLDNHRIIAYGDESSLLNVMSFACRVAAMTARRARPR